MENCKVVKGAQYANNVVKDTVLADVHGHAALLPLGPNGLRLCGYRYPSEIGAAITAALSHQPSRIQWRPEATEDHRFVAMGLGLDLVIKANSATECDAWVERLNLAAEYCTKDFTSIPWEDLMRNCVRSRESLRSMLHRFGVFESSPI